jgi:hypothetical protein
MAILIKTQQTPIPEGVYNLQVVSCELKSQKNNPEISYLVWGIKVLDPLPEDFLGRDNFTVLTAAELTDRNNLNRFLTNIGINVELGQEIDTDSLIGHKFVGKVVVVTRKNGQETNGLGQLTIPEFKQFELRQKQKKVVAAQATMSKPKQVVTPNTSNNPSVKYSNPVSIPKPKSVKTVVDDSNEIFDEGVENQNNEEEEFPDELFN